jgi:hypothetical protein
MTQIIISDLQSQGSHSLPLLLKDDKNGLISTSVKRSLDAQALNSRKISGGCNALCRLILPPSDPFAGRVIDGGR